MHRFVVLISVLGLVACAQTQPKDEQIRAWVEKNPEVIMKALMDFQRKQAEEGQAKPADIAAASQALFADAADPIGGNPDGKLKIAYFFDFNCGHCAHQGQTLKAVLAERNDVRVAYKILPVLGPASEMIARAALAAHLQGKFADYYVELYKTKDRSPVSLKKMAAKLKLDMKKWEADQNGAAVGELLGKNQDLAMKLKINGTPFLAIAPDHPFPGRVDQLSEILKDISAKN